MLDSSHPRLFSPGLRLSVLRLHSDSKWGSVFLFPFFSFVRINLFRDFVMGIWILIPLNWFFGCFSFSLFEENDGRSIELSLRGVLELCGYAYVLFESLNPFGFSPA